MMPAFSSIRRSSILQLPASRTPIPSPSAGHWPGSWTPAHPWSPPVPAGTCPTAQGGLPVLAWSHLGPPSSFLWALHLPPRGLSKERGSPGPVSALLPGQPWRNLWGPAERPYLESGFLLWKGVTPCSCTALGLSLGGGLCTLLQRLLPLTPTRAPGHSLGARGHFFVQKGPLSQIW